MREYGPSMGSFVSRTAGKNEAMHDRFSKYRLELAEDLDIEAAPSESLPHTRMIPSAVKLEVWQRDKGRCVICGQEDNLHFDHDLPYSKGGTSLTAKNIRLLCARHNLSKSDKIQ